ncbi:MAG: hypothetical protein GY832_31620 [Chloroflexi bacterium]|nr:hypothetical protein [Chloroflexota bacterium]
MGLFGKPKKKKKVAVGKGSYAEKIKAEFNLRQKYPQMYEEGWGKPKKKEKKKKSDGTNAVTKSVQAQLAAAGVSKKEMPSDVDKRKKKGKK